MIDAYSRAMDQVHRLCLLLAGAALVIITLIIPYGVFTRFVLNSAASWPEPMAVLLMIVLSFLSAVICYREHLHIAVGILPNMAKGALRTLLGLIVESAMLATNVFLLWYGTNLCVTTWYQSIAEFPDLSVGVSYLPIPIGGALTVLFIIERALKGDWFAQRHEPDELGGRDASGK